jgi:hypothetical protein
VTRKEYENLQSGDLIYYEHETDDMSVIWEYTGSTGAGTYNMKVVSMRKGQDVENNFIDFSLSYDSSTGIKEMKIIAKEDYPEYFL